MWTKKKKSLDFGLTCAVDDDHQSRTPLGGGGGHGCRAVKNVRYEDNI